MLEHVYVDTIECWNMFMWIQLIFRSNANSLKCEFAQVRIRSTANSLKCEFAQLRFAQVRIAQVRIAQVRISHGQHFVSVVVNGSRDLAAASSLTLKNFLKNR
ncbi:MAG: hypothetical protein FD143_3780 [Ignavibacteria bacterium]|nr:MAG: hypothetical protein FD143_3780 [Ignavibacteria bacterium]